MFRRAHPHRLQPLLHHEPVVAFGAVIVRHDHGRNAHVNVRLASDHVGRAGASECGKMWMNEETRRLNLAVSASFQGWEETTDAALTFLLRTSLAKPGKENQGATPITLDVPKDTTRLKKHISSVMDRISKGGRIVDGKNAIEGE